MSGVLDRKTALAVLGLTPGAEGEAVARAFRQAVKRAHPDRGGDARRLQAIVEAYRLLQHETPAPAPLAQRPTLARPRMTEAVIDVRTALIGGAAEALTADGRRLSLRIEPGARIGQVVEAESERFELTIRDEGVTVRGDDLWINHTVDAAVLADGGRLAVDTPWGRRCFWINRKTAARGLARLPGDGLPATENRRQGDLFIRLVPRDVVVESPVRLLLRRFAAAWAA